MEKTSRYRMLCCRKGEKIMFIGCWICGNKIEEKFELPRKRSWNDSVTVCKECYEKFKDDYPKRKK